MAYYPKIISIRFLLRCYKVCSKKVRTLVIKSLLQYLKLYKCLSPLKYSPLLAMHKSAYRRHFLKQNLARAYECWRGFYLYHEGLESECSDVVLFWRIDQVLKVTANAVRQQVMNREAQRLDKEIKQVLEEFNQHSEIKEKLLTGRRVTLAEKLKRVKRIQEKLEFIQALNKEKIDEGRR